MDDEITIRPARPGLQMPAQVAPVCRAGSPGGGVAGAGVEADISLDDVLGAVGKVAGVAGPILGAFGI